MAGEEILGSRPIDRAPSEPALGAETRKTGCWKAALAIFGLIPSSRHDPGHRKGERRSISTKGLCRDKGYRPFCLRFFLVSAPLQAFIMSMFGFEG
jgi:hypothetical protein